MIRDCVKSLIFQKIDSTSEKSGPQLYCLITPQCEKYSCLMYPIFAQEQKSKPLPIKNKDILAIREIAICILNFSKTSFIDFN